MVKLKGEHRKAQILKAAETIARTHGLYHASLNFDAIALSSKCSRPTVKYHFGSLQAIREHLIKQSFAGDKLLYRQALEELDPIAGNLANGSQ